jgi:phosphoglycolate phosphatase
LLIVFDLDGTLIDSSQDLAASMNATRVHLGMPPIDPNQVYSFVGNGVRLLVERALGAGATADLVERGYRFFLSHYEQHALDDTKPYPGIIEMLNDLARRHTLSLLTNKPVLITSKIVEGLRISPYFHAIYGGDSFPAKKPDPTGLIQLMNETGIPAEKTVMVGDSGVDIQTARNAGVRGFGVLWGFQPASVRESDPDVLIARPEELAQHIV